MLPLTLTAAECTARSGPTTAALVELYTSEGCSSCPPADKWLSQLDRSAPGRIVPVAFHVTYWDYIGWKDAYASERHTVRQRERADAAGARYVYTPQVTVGGREFREWSSGSSFDKAVARINLMPARADLEIRVQPAEGGKLAVTTNATLKQGVAVKDLALVVATTQNGVSSRVTAGENRGEQLRHDFVVRDLFETRGFSAAGFATTNRTLAMPNVKAGSLAISAFVQNLKTGEVLQALSAPACPA